MVEAFALLVSFGAVTVAVLALLASYKALRASVFDRRFEVYEEAERFLAAWNRDGRPDMGALPAFVHAWTKSHFLFDAAVTEYLRSVWIDAARADYLQKIVTGDATGDRNEAAKEAIELMMQRASFEALRDAFLPHMRVSDRLFGRYRHAHLEPPRL